MPKKRNKDNINTTISIRWVDKKEMRKYARLIKTTKTGNNYESDAEVFFKILDNYKRTSPIPHSNDGKPTSTYPSKNRDESQPRS